MEQAMSKRNERFVLAINGGSSSIRFAAYRIEAEPVRILAGKLDRIGQPLQHLVFHDAAGTGQERQQIDLPGSGPAPGLLLDWLAERLDFGAVRAIGHRVVHGLQHTEAQLVTPELLSDLRAIIALDWDHLPRQIELIEECGRRFPQLPQLACFDTAFHRTLPPVARLLPIPRRFDALGIRRYGFHGLSYAYLMQRLAQLSPQRAQGRIILAHIGSGVSMAAVYGGNSIDTSMGFTPSGGLPMGTRSGDLDPGLVCHLMQREGLSVTQLSRLINQESGLLGMSGSSADMRDLLEREMEDVRAAEAIASFCYQARKWIGAYAAALDGLDTLVFSGGIGENQPAVRARICDGLSFLGIALDADGNAAGEGVISAPHSRVEVRVIRTDEEWIIARALGRLLEPGAREGDQA